MPIKKLPKLKQPLWKEKDYKALKRGLHHTVYCVNGDSYNGEWRNNKKDGPGTYLWKKSGAIYEGDWKDDLRNGFGMYSLPTVEARYRKVYVGGWVNDKKQGNGTYYYNAQKYYEGEWYENMRNGWGRMYYEDGSTYEGEWYNDKRTGTGMLRLCNDNRYEGMWKNDKKHGEGIFFFLDKGQVLFGTWVDGITKCGVMKDFNRDTAIHATKYPIPELKLLNAHDVVSAARQHFSREP